MTAAAPAARCLICTQPTADPEAPIAGLRDEPEALVAVVCSPACAAEARRFAARRSAQLQPARAGLLVAGLGLVTAALFAWTGRELGRILLVLGLFGAGTSCLAYPDAVPLALARAAGLTRARLLRQWAGVLVAASAVALALLFVVVR